MATNVPYRVTISLDTPYDIAYWGIIFDATLEELLVATQEVGFDAMQVRAYFHKTRKIRGPVLPPGWEPTKG